MNPNRNTKVTKGVFLPTLSIIVGIKMVPVNTPKKEKTPIKETNPGEQ
jgi:hypothetical protein